MAMENHPFIDDFSGKPPFMGKFHSCLDWLDARTKRKLVCKQVLQWPRESSYAQYCPAHNTVNRRIRLVDWFNQLLHRHAVIEGILQGAFLLWRECFSSMAWRALKYSLCTMPSIVLFTTFCNPNLLIVLIVGSQNVIHVRPFCILFTRESNVYERILFLFSSPSCNVERSLEEIGIMEGELVYTLPRNQNIMNEPFGMPRWTNVLMFSLSLGNKTWQWEIPQISVHSLYLADYPTPNTTENYCMRGFLVVITYIHQIYIYIWCVPWQPCCWSPSTGWVIFLSAQ